jgi:hypothetical protein
MNDALEHKDAEMKEINIKYEIIKKTNGILEKNLEEMKQIIKEHESPMETQRKKYEKILGDKNIEKNLLMKTNEDLTKEYNLSKKIIDEKTEMCKQLEREKKNFQMLEKQQEYKKLNEKYMNLVIQKSQEIPPETITLLNTIKILEFELEAAKNTQKDTTTPVDSINNAKLSKIANEKYISGLLGKRK